MKYHFMVVREVTLRMQCRSHTNCNLILKCGRQQTAKWKAALQWGLQGQTISKEEHQDEAQRVKVRYGIAVRCRPSVGSDLAPSAAA